MISVRISKDFLWRGFDHEFGWFISEKIRGQRIFLILKFSEKNRLPRDDQIINLAAADRESIVASQVVPIYNSIPFGNLFFNF